MTAAGLLLAPATSPSPDLDVDGPPAISPSPDLDVDGPPAMDVHIENRLYPPFAISNCSCIICKM